MSTRLQVKAVTKPQQRNTVKEIRETDVIERDSEGTREAAVREIIDEKNHLQGPSDYLLRPAHLEKIKVPNGNLFRVPCHTLVSQKDDPFFSRPRNSAADF
jgi:hypothetical protein